MKNTTVTLVLVPTDGARAELILKVDADVAQSLANLIHSKGFTGHVVITSGGRMDCLNLPQYSRITIY
jgi:hypothetical protein